MFFISRSPQETKIYAKKWAKKVTTEKYPRFLFFFGEMGSGKTTFLRAFGQELGIASEINSPTYSIFQRYLLPETEKFSSLFHFDLYRTAERSPFSFLEMAEQLSDPSAIVAVEWAEYIPENMRPKKRIELHFSHQKNEERYIGVNIFSP